MFNNNKECKGIALFIIFYLFKYYIKNLFNRNCVRWNQVQLKIKKNLILIIIIIIFIIIIVILMFRIRNIRNRKMINNYIHIK